MTPADITKDIQWFESLLAKIMSIEGGSLTLGQACSIIEAYSQGCAEAELRGAEAVERAANSNGCYSARDAARKATAALEEIRNR